MKRLLNKQRMFVQFREFKSKIWKFKNFSTSVNLFAYRDRAIRFLFKVKSDYNFPLCQPDKILITTDNRDLLVFLNKMLYFRIDTRKHKHAQRPSNDLGLLNGSSEKQVVQTSKILCK